MVGTAVTGLTPTLHVEPERTRSVLHVTDGKKIIILVLTVPAIEFVKRKVSSSGATLTLIFTMIATLVAVTGATRKTITQLLLCSVLDMVFTMSCVVLRCTPVVEELHCG